MTVQLNGSHSAMRFGAKQKLPKPLYAAITTGDGESHALLFTSQKEAERYGNADDEVRNEQPASIQKLTHVYTTAEEAINDWHGEDNERLNYLA